MDISFRSLGNLFSGAYLNGTDQYTRGLTLDHMYSFFFPDQKEVYTTITGNEYNLYKTTPQLFIVINRKASMFSNGVFKVKDYKTGDLIENHPLLMLLEKPNPLMNRNLWLEDISKNYDVFGNAFIYKNYGSTLLDFPSLLTNLPNTGMKIIKTGKIYKQPKIEDIIQFYRLELSGKKDDYTPKEIIHLKNTNLEDPTIGLSPIHALQMPVTNIRGAYGFRNVNITKRGALHLISSSGKDSIGSVKLGDDDRLDLEKQFVNESHGIYDNQSSIKFSNSPLDVQSLSFPIKDSMLFEEVDHNFKAIIDNYGLNENIFSRVNASKFNNLAEGLRMAYQDGIIPFAEKFCFALNEGLGLFEKGIYVELDYSHIPVMKEDEMSKAQTIQIKADAAGKLVAAGYSNDEALIIVGLKE